MNARPTCVSTFLLKGGLNHMIFLRLLSWFGGLCGAGLNLRLYAYPLMRKASWYRGAASLNASSSEEISDSLLLIASGMFLIMLGGWFDILCTYRGVVAGFESNHVVVIVHDENQPRGKWPIGRVEALVTGSDVWFKTKVGRLTKLSLVQQLYSLEVCCRNEDLETTISPHRTEPDPALSSVKSEQHPELWRNSPRRVPAIEGDQRQKASMKNLNKRT